ncbi:MAG TPA: hypothetical protein PLQ00_17450, partial [Thermoguttaceae bacterium]|nr:hypothetical protein [Thermoguttaceae bacterium]
IEKRMSFVPFPKSDIPLRGLASLKWRSERGLLKHPRKAPLTTQQSLAVLQQMGVSTYQISPFEDKISSRVKEIKEVSYHLLEEVLMGYFPKEEYFRADRENFGEG